MNMSSTSTIPNSLLRLRKRAMIREVFGVNREDLTLEEIQVYLKDETIQRKVAQYYLKHPEEEEVVQAFAKYLIHAAIGACEKGVFDELLLNPKEFKLLIEGMDSLITLERQSGNAHTFEHSRAGVTVLYEELVQMGCINRITGLIATQSEILSTSKQIEEFLLWQGAQMSFQVPLIKNPFFTALVDRSIDKYKPFIKYTPK